ncbi:MAG: SDR family NAD(P)-dependent oxidoreductase [Oscillatoria sp. SIO1A7]|nr:SDR family NAD(P)-dependent oxidoreductase [Oscillatoria sp. SIO1A7]
MNNNSPNKVCIVTGGNSGVGLMTAVGLAKTGYRVFIACRSHRKAAKAVNFIRRRSGNANVESLPLNLASLESVRQFVNFFQNKNIALDLLVNNAGIFNKRGVTREGFELIWGTNYLGHFLLTYLLLDNLKQSRDAKIIMVASDLALRPQSIKWSLFVKKTPLNFLELYSLSKSCLLLLTVELARQLNNSNVTVNAVHPGFVRSNITIWHRLSKYLGLGISPKKGAYSTLYCATAAELEGVSGKFFDSKARSLPLPKLAEDLELARELWEKSLIWTGCEVKQKNIAPDYNKYDNIWGTYSLALDKKEIRELSQNIFKQVLPKPPNKLLILSWFKLLLKGEIGSACLLLVQVFKREFHMERHLDSAAVWKICQDENLLAKLREYLGEELALWRSELWVNYPAQQLIPFWHRDLYSKLLVGEGKTINVYIALTEVNEFNGFEFLEGNADSLSVKVTDPFSGNSFFDIPEELAKKAIPVVLKPGEFLLFTDELVHRSVCNTSGRVRLSLTLRVTQPSVKVLPGYSSNYREPVLL